ncbi:MAG: hypothetical protein M3040_17750 [Bacteroidota bacterium]|nr:hypothetical protein [Bacteroidota bacterium]
MLTSTPYSLSVLATTIPTANLEEIKRISLKMKEEQDLYNNREFHQILILVSDRLIQLSRQRRSI